MDENNEYEEYVEEMEEPTEQNRPRQQDVYQEPQPPKKTFRFPLMDDEFEPQQQKRLLCSSRRRCFNVRG